MDLLTAITEATCGMACWAAREDVCRCSCAGQNHGVVDRGSQPERTRKLNGWLYQLVAVETPGASCIAVGERPLRDLKWHVMKGVSEAGKRERYQYDSTPGYPVKIKVASEGEVNRWPELASFRESRSRYWRPSTLWVRCDLVEFVN